MRKEGEPGTPNHNMSDFTSRTITRNVSKTVDSCSDREAISLHLHRVLNFGVARMGESQST